MPDDKKSHAFSKRRLQDPGSAVSLKQLAGHLGLSTTSLSLVLNDSPKARSIPQETKDRIFDAARRLNYRPNQLARSLRVQRTHTLGIIVSEVSDNYAGVVLNGIEAVLAERGYLYLLVSHLRRREEIETYFHMLVERQVEGLIAVNSTIPIVPTLPTVNVSGHNRVAGVTNVTVNHQHAAELGLGHLIALGHHHIAVIKGQKLSADTNIRWKTIASTARALNVPIDPRLVVQLTGEMRSPEVGYVATKKLLAAGKKFTALFAFNDISAIGAIRALEEAGLRVPSDVSVLGFDDVYGAAFHNPPLTTIRQPLFEMGSLAATTILNNLNGGNGTFIPEISVEPTLIVRESTSNAPTR